MSGFLGKTFNKIVGQKSRDGSAGSASGGSSNGGAGSVASLTQSGLTYQQDTQLTLAHLRKVFYEYLHPKQELSQVDKDERIYSLLPLFIRAFGTCALNDIYVKFSDANDFCFACSKLLVTEISKRVHDDLVLVKFFEIKSSDESSDGSGLLNAVNILASGPITLIESMVQCKLPSSLVMCLYLFICLPEPKDSRLDTSEFSASERRTLFQKSFQQLVIKLCQYPCTCDELSDSDSLKLLFTIITSICDTHNISWRRTAFDALATLSKNLTLKAINYLHTNDCIQKCLESIDEQSALNINEKIDVLITLILLIKDSSRLSQSLIDDFRSLGYRIISDIVFKLEKENRDDLKSNLKNLLYYFEELVYVGHNELKLCSTKKGEMFQMPGYKMSTPLGKGKTVQNIYAFQCLLNMFNKSQTHDVNQLILNKIRNIYEKDEYNYCLLESHNILLYSLDNLSVKIHNKPHDIQQKFVEILEYIACSVKFVPCKELINIGLAIQNNNAIEWNILCGNFLFKLVKLNQVYKDAFRELGLLEMMISYLRKFAALLKEKSVEAKDNEAEIDPLQRELAFVIMDTVACLLSQNSSNAKLFRELGGARLAHNMVPYKLCRNQALTIVSSLLLSTAGEDDMATLLGLMHTAKLEDLELKNAVLRSLLYTLRESHRTRTVFRKVGGFVYVVSVLISMDGCLASQPKAPWNKVSKQSIYTILKTVFHTLSVAMRYEPANAKFFETEVRWKSLTAALKLLGCFNASVDQFEATSHQSATSNDNTFVKRNFDVFEKFFCSLDEKCLQAHVVDENIIHVCYIMRYLYDTAIDSFDKSVLLYDFSDGFEDRQFSKHYNENLSKSESPKFSQPDSDTSNSAQSQIQVTPNYYLSHQSASSSRTQSGCSDYAQTPDVNNLKRTFSFSSVSASAYMNNPLDEPLIVHSGAIIAMLQLCASITAENKSNQMDKRLQFHMINLIKNLCRFDRNQQIMSHANLVDTLLSTCNNVLNDETHFLNSSIQHIFERLSSQVLTAKNLRDYLRSGTLYDHQNPDRQLVSNANKYLNIPLNRVKCLISMTTPRDYKTYIGVPFVEFNMFIEGFGCIFLPSIAPQLASPPSIVAMGMVSVGNDLSINGGIGIGERVFPPQSGLTYSTWICVDKFGSLSPEKIHPIRILTILRHIQGKESMNSCLAIFLSPKNRSLFISTEETLLQKYDPKIFDQDLKLSDTLVKLNCSELFQEGQWLHLAFVFSRAMIKNSTVSVYANANCIGTCKLHYINSNLTTNQQYSTSIHAVIGTLPILRHPSPVIWRQASSYLFEDVLSLQTIQTIYQLGPGYLGSFQSPPIDFNDSTPNNAAIVSEDKIVFGLHAQNTFEMTLAKFRKVYNKNDSKAIGKHLNIPSSESATPIRILSNTSCQLNGPSRSIGGAIIGFLGVRTFQPQPVSKSIESIGGVSFLLSLTAMAKDIEFMYASVKALVCVVKCNRETCKEMDRLDAYHILAMLYRRKKHLINSHILNLTFSLVTADDMNKEQAIITNVKAFESLLCELDVWYDTPAEIQRSLHERFNDLLNDQANARLFHRLGMLQRLLFIVKGHVNLSDNTLKYILSTIKLLLAESSSENILKFGQFMISLLPDKGLNEKQINLSVNFEQKDRCFIDNDQFTVVYSIKLRNRLLNIIDEMTAHSGEKISSFQEEFQRILGYDWFFLFMQQNVHSTTVMRTSKILFKLIVNNSQTLSRFKECHYYGGWLNEIANRLNGSKANLLSNTGDVSSSTFAPSTSLIQSIQLERTDSASIEACAVPGFQMIQFFYSKHTEVVELYYLLFALLFDNQKIKELPQTADLDLNSICKYVFDKTFDSEQTIFTKINLDFCLDVSIVLLSMIRSLMNQLTQQNVDVLLGLVDENSANLNVKDYPIILLQIFRFMYHNCDDFHTMASNPEFLSSLVHTLYPYNELTESQASTPLIEVKPFAESMTDIKYNSTLSTHPARKLIMDFVRDLIIDGLTSSNTQTKSLSIIDYILVSLPELNNVKRNQELVTEVFKCVMDCLLTTDIFNSDNNTSPNTIIANTSGVIDRLVDKLWDGTYKRESKEVFDLIIRLIESIKKKNNSYSIEQLLNAMNRTILYQLSRPNELLSDQIAVLDVLHKITKQKSLVFSQLNSQPEFFACITHCLIVLTETDQYNPDSRTEWYVPLPQSTVSGENKTDAKSLLISAAQRVWLDLYLTKKSVLEEALRINLGVVGKTATLDQLRHVMAESAAKVWSSFIEGEKRLPERIQNQLQQKFHRVTGGISTMAGGLSRVVTLKKPKKDIPKLNQSQLSDAITSISTNVNAVKELTDMDYRKYCRTLEQYYSYLHDEWINIEKDLLRERAIWGEDLPNPLEKWKLDFTEGPNRTRKRLVQNEEFYRHYPYRPEIDFLKPNRKYKIPTSLDSRENFKRATIKSLLHQDTSSALTVANTLNKIDSIGDSLDTWDNTVSTNGEAINTDAPVVKEILSTSIRKQLVRQTEQEDDDEQPSQQTQQDSTNSTEAHQQPTTPTTATVTSSQTPNNQNILRLLEDGEKINHTYRCARVHGLDTFEGVLLFGKEHFYVLDGFTLISPKDIVDIDCLKAATYEPLIPRSMPTNSSSSSSAAAAGQAQVVTEKLCSKFAYEDIREVHKRRYLLQPISLEIFSNDGRNYLLVFPRKCRNKIYEKLIALTPDLNDSAQQSIAGQKRNTNIEQSAGLFNALMGEKSVTQRWERGEITNFQYLMYLNTLAGRSYNDLMQYPVFPWILADYDSDELDFNSKTAFRDLSKPMGAQTSDRLLQFQKRFQEWDDPSGETPPYHYGTHYSSAMIVASYLVRMEPFAQIFLRLQGGHFDLADRMFHSIKDNWLSASRNNMADVKELIPEFFYLPEFLVNSNKFDLGRKQNGVTLDDVVLPPWAKNDPREFIRLHRAALESDYVSAHLNEWIDLIFGHKQQGQAATDAVNVFHHLFYEGAVNIDDIDDPLKRNAIIGFINNFGQIPKQLFKKPHPTKKINSQFLYGLSNPGNNPISTGSNLSALGERQQTMFFHYLNSLKPSMQPIRELKTQIGQIMPTDKGVLVVEQNKILMPPTYQRYIAWGFADESIKIGYTDYEKSYVSFENVQDGAVFCCCSPDSKCIITAGSCTTINVWELGKVKNRRLQLKARLYGHTDTITCMCVSSAYHMLVSGSRDQTCIIWDMNSCKFIRQLVNHFGAVSCVAINDLTGDIATASGTFLYVWSINGDLLASINTMGACRNQIILCICMSQVNEWDKDNVILTGGTDGVVRMWSLDYTQEPIQGSSSAKSDATETVNKKPNDFQRLDSVNETQSKIASPSPPQTPNFYVRSHSSGGESDVEFSATDYTHRSEKDAKSKDSQEQGGSVIAGELDEEYVLISKNEFYDKSKSQLKPGHKWVRELVFRSKLTMHTAYDRKDNAQPAAVSAIAISKDNKTLYVGDTRGRVFSWTVNDNPGRQRADHWTKDDVVETCKSCHLKFTFSERKHHCRDCGGIYCNTCTRFETEIPRLNITKPVRVCQTCYNNIKSEEGLASQLPNSN